MILSITAARIGAACLACACLGAKAARADPTQCFSPAETRERIRADKLAEPLVPMRRAAARLQAEALNARLCRSGGDLFYEISLLTPEGKIARAYIDARSGQPLAAPAGARR